MAAWQIQKVLSRLAWRECAPENYRRQFPDATGVLKYDSQLHCQNQRWDNHGFPSKLTRLNVDIKPSKQSKCGNIPRTRGLGFPQTHQAVRKCSAGTGMNRQSKP